MKRSNVLTNYLSTVIDAVNNHGCAIAQHGGDNWTTFDEKGLNDYFDSEKLYWDSIGVTVKSAVCPSHFNTDLIRAIAGARFGVVRCGYDYVDNHYDYFSSGSRSNLYGMSSYNINSKDLAENKLAIDYAIENKKILNIYWHDHDLNDSQKEVLEATIDYAKTKGIEFILLEDIPNLI